MLAHYQTSEISKKDKKNFHALIRASSHENLPFFKKKLQKKKKRFVSFRPKF
jgi:hypothetical protein